MFRTLLRVLVVMLACCDAMLAASAFGQSTSATVSGVIVDETGAAVPDVVVTIINVGTRLQRETKTSKEGQFLIPLLPPGRYTLTATREGFTPLEARDVVLNVNDQVTLRLRLKVAAVGEQVTVVAEPSRVSTSPAVSTVIDRQFVENIPLNGRSLQSLLELTPGVVLAGAGNNSEGGQFSVNGQRTSANYFTVDGVSANAGISASPNTPGGTGVGQAGAGQLPALTAQGGTNSLVAVDALQEFRIQTSTFSPEFGRTPGGQVSLVTRSGTNDLRGSFFEYFRDESMDAADWFVNARALRQPELRQHQFGGVLGGPLLRDRLFFFGSYEGLRLKQPKAVLSRVPSMALRQAASATFHPYLAAFPIPNGREFGDGSAEFAASYSDPSRFDSTSVRVDHQARQGLAIFARFSHTPSYTRARSTSVLTSTNNARQINTSLTVGSTWVATERLVHDVRVNYTTTFAPWTAELDDFGGAVPLPTSVFAPGRSPANAQLNIGVFPFGAFNWGVATAYEQRQINIVDSVTLTSVAHALKFGLDFRRMDPLLNRTAGGLEVLTFTVASLAVNQALRYAISVQGSERQRVAFDNLSLYAQDNWKISPRLTATYGLRWEFVPPPHATQGQNAVTLEGLDNPYGGQVHISPRNTPLWRTRYNNFAPRVGASYMLSQRPGAETTVRGGYGLFHDLGFGQVASTFVTYPFFARRDILNVAFPLAPEVRSPPRLVIDPPSGMTILDRNLALPHTHHWNVAVEQSLGNRQTLTATYVAAEGRKLLKAETYNITLLEWPTVRTPVFVNRNRGYSDYRALQLQFQRRLHQGLQALASYTLGRSRDTSSSDSARQGAVPHERVPIDLDYGYSDYDVRHVFTTAITYQLPTLRGPRPLHLLARDWGVDLIMRARSGVPIYMSALVAFPPDNESVRPNIVAGQPFWLEDAAAPGGRRLNTGAFTSPPSGTQGNLPRGAVRGFGARQVDVAVRRELRLFKAARLQLRFEVFNVTNTPNFADPPGSLITLRRTSQSESMLGGALGGLNSLYQIGGPRSAQLAAKVLF
jgi:hypothetical protein